MFLIQFVNVSGRDHHAADLKEAEAICRRNSFEAVVVRDGTVHATWSPISGWRVVPALALEWR